MCYLKSAIKYLAIILLAINISCKKDMDIVVPSILPIVITDSTINITSIKVILTARINPIGVLTKYYFDYGNGQNYGLHSSVGKEVGSGTSDISVKDTIYNLTPSSLYHYRVVAFTLKDTVYGLEKIFSTGLLSDSLIPKVDVPSIINGFPNPHFGISSVFFTAKIKPMGLDTKCYFEYGLTTNYGTAVEKEIDASKDEEYTSAEVKNLVVKETYHWRVVGKNSAGVFMSKDTTFIFPDVKPLIFNLRSNGVSSSSVVLYGSINSAGRPISCYFEYSKNQDFITSLKTQKQNINSGNQTVNISAIINNLEYGSMYYYRIIVESPNGDLWWWGEKLWFNTLLNAVEFNYPLIIGKIWKFRYSLVAEYSISGTSPPSEVRKGIRIWEVMSKDSTAQQITYHLFCTAQDTVMRRVQIGAPPDTSYEEQLNIPFTIVVTPNVISVDYAKTVKFATSFRSGPIIPLSRYVESGTMQVQLGSALYMDGVGIIAYDAGSFSNSGGYLEHFNIIQ